MHAPNWWWRKCPLAILFQCQHSLTVVQILVPKVPGLFICPSFMEGIFLNFLLFPCPLHLVPPPFFFFFGGGGNVSFHIWCMTDTAVSSYRPSIQKRITKQNLVGIMVVHLFEGTGADHLEEAVSPWGPAVWNSQSIQISTLCTLAVCIFLHSKRCCH